MVEARSLPQAIASKLSSFFPVHYITVQGVMESTRRSNIKNSPNLYAAAGWKRLVQTRWKCSLTLADANSFDAWGAVHLQAALDVDNAKALGLDLFYPI